MRRLALRLLGLALLAAFRADAADDNLGPCLTYGELDLGNGLSLDLPDTVCAARHSYTNDELFHLEAKGSPGAFLLDFWAHRVAPDPWIKKNPRAEEIVLAETRTVLPFTLEFAGATCQPILRRPLPEGGDRPEARFDASVDCVREDGARTTKLLSFWREELSSEARKTAEAILASLRPTHPEGPRGSQEGGHGGPPLPSRR